MKIGPKFKIARRLGSAVFKKTQTAKFAQTAERKNFSLSGVRSRSSYGAQLLEKQKARYSYGLSAKQLTNYVKKVIAAKVKNSEEALFQLLEKRLDNVVMQSGLAKTRFQARQIVSHGHVRVNGKKMKVPSYEVRVKDEITLKDSSKDKVLFSDFKEASKDSTAPDWLRVDAEKMSVTVLSEPAYDPARISFNMSDVIQFHKR